MEKKINIMIQEFQNGNVNQFLLISDRFKPLIKKYARLLYKEESEDTASEMNLAILEAIHKIKYTDREYQCVAYLSAAMRNRFLKLYTKSRKKFDYEFQMDYGQELYDTNNEYEEIEFRHDFDKYLLDYNDKQKRILESIVFEGKSNAAISKEYNVSRQYTHRVKNTLYKKIKREANVSI